MLKTTARYQCHGMFGLIVLALDLWYPLASFGSVWPTHQSTDKGLSSTSCLTVHCMTSLCLFCIALKEITVQPTAGCATVHCLVKCEACVFDTGETYSCQAARATYADLAGQYLDK